MQPIAKVVSSQSLADRLEDFRREVKSGRVSLADSSPPDDSDEIRKRLTESRGLREALEASEPDKREEIAERVRNAELRAKLSRAGLVGKYRSWSWETCPEQAASLVTPLREALEQGRSVLLMGINGTGKTGLAVGAVRWYLEQGKSARIVLVPRFLRELNETYRRDSRVSTLEVVDDLSGSQAPDLVVLDDLGAEESVSVAVKRDIGLLVHQLDVYEKQAIVSTNLDPAGDLLPTIESEYGERTLSRLRDYVAIKVAGEELRGRDLR